MHEELIAMPVQELAHLVQKKEDILSIRMQAGFTLVKNDSRGLSSGIH